MKRKTSPSKFDLPSRKKLKNEKNNVNQFTENLIANAKKANGYTEFTKLKYKNLIYSVGDTVFIKNGEDEKFDFIAKLQRIMKLEGLSGEVKFLIEVIWLYKKSEIDPKSLGSYVDCVGSNEIFMSNHSDIIFVECINGKCKVCDIEEYDRLGGDASMTEPTFYCRSKYALYMIDIEYLFAANYNHITHEITPEIEKWPKICICERPMNPEFAYILCEICNKWYHIRCMELEQNAAETIEAFQCKSCLNEKSCLKIKISLSLN